jgi:putative transposase
LQQDGLVWRRPRPVLGPEDPTYAYKSAKIRRHCANLSDDETVVFECVFDLNTEPKFGAMWMRHGQ